MNRLPPVPPASKPRSASTSTNIETSSPNVTENSKNSEPDKEAPPPLSPQLKQEINLFQLEDYAKKIFSDSKEGRFQAVDTSQKSFKVVEGHHLTFPFETERQTLQRGCGYF
jgi:hypothetical protein